MSGAVVLLARSVLRRQWRGLVVIVLLSGLAGGVTLAAFAGARRTSTSFDRFLVSSRNHDVIVFATSIGPRDVTRLRASPGVAGIGYARQLSLVRPDGDFLAVGGPLDRSLFHDVDRLRIVTGRPPDPGRPEEVVVGEALARTQHLAPGDRLPVASYTQAQIDRLQNDERNGAPPPLGPHVVLRVVGISRSPIDLSLQGAEGGLLLLPRAFVEKYGGRIGNFSGPTGGVLLVRLRDGAAGVPRFLREARAVLGARSFDVDPAALSVGGVQESVDVLAIGLAVFGVVTGVAGLIALTLVVGRQLSVVADGQQPVRDLGLSRRGRAAALALPVLFAVALGSLLAVLVAWLASPLMPFGVAGQAEPDPGLHFDAGALLLGLGATVVLLGTVTAVAAWVVARPRRGRDQRRRLPSAVSRLLENSGLRPATTVGVRLALEPGRGRTAVPVRSALIGIVVAVLGVTAVVVFTSSLDSLRTTPRSYGVPWDAVVSDTRVQLGPSGSICGRVRTRVTRDRDAATVANVCSASITLDERAVGGIGIVALRGRFEPSVIDGRAPDGRNEVALGTKTMDALGVHLGDQVTARGGARTARYRVVGRVVVPSVGDAQAVADGAVFAGAGLSRLETTNSGSTSASIVVRWRPGVDPVAAARRLDRLRGIVGFGQPGVARVAVPLDVDRLAQTDRMPRALALFLTLLGLVAVGHLLVTSVQRRRRDFAILKTVGFVHRQVYGSVGAQATTVAVIGLAVGIVTGVAAGGLVWRAAAERVGVLVSVDVSVLDLALVALATIVLVNLVAAWPARRAARTRPALVLRDQ